VTPAELESYDAMMKDRDHWKSLYFTMRELSDNATDIAERREQENARLRELVKRACKIIDVPEDAPITAWASDDEINDLLKDCGDILSNTSMTCPTKEG
jgi:hypothetical protein